MQKKYLAVFCSAADVDEKYIKATKDFARTMVKKGYHLVWGGSDRGLMKVLADEFAKEGRDLIGVSIEIFNHMLREDITETVITPTLGERKATMLQRADAIVVLAGGIGTLDEVTDAIELKRQGKNSKPIVFLNTDHFFDGLIWQFARMQSEGFIHHTHMDELVYFADTIEQVEGYIAKNLGKEFQLQYPALHVLPSVL